MSCPPVCALAGRAGPLQVCGDPGAEHRVGVDLGGPAAWVCAAQVRVDWPVDPGLRRALGDLLRYHRRAPADVAGGLPHPVPGL
jgi:hypothetical protein